MVDVDCKNIGKVIVGWENKFFLLVKILRISVSLFFFRRSNINISGR